MAAACLRERSRLGLARTIRSHLFFHRVHFIIATGTLRQPIKSVYLKLLKKIISVVLIYASSL